LHLKVSATVEGGNQQKGNAHQCCVLKDLMLDDGKTERKTTPGSFRKRGWQPNGLQEYGTEERNMESETEREKKKGRTDGVGLIFSAESRGAEKKKEVSKTLILSISN